MIEVKVPPEEQGNLKTGDVIFVEKAFFALTSGHLSNMIYGGFYTVRIDGEKTYLDPQNGSGSFEVDLDTNQDNWHKVLFYQSEAVKNLRRTAGWKLHINFSSANQAHILQVTQALNSLKNEGLIKDFKVGKSGGQTGKEATIYVGPKKSADEVSQRLESELADVLLPPEGDTLRDDVHLTPTVMARFDAAGDNTFHQYGSNGIPYLKGDVMRKDLTPKEKRQRALRVLQERYGSFFGSAA